MQLFFLGISARMKIYSDYSKFSDKGCSSDRPRIMGMILHECESVEIRVVLSMSRFFYCEGAITRRHHLARGHFIAYIKHIFEDYITQQTYVQ